MKAQQQSKDKYIFEIARKYNEWVFERTVIPSIVVVREKVVNYRQTLREAACLL